MNKLIMIFSVLFVSSNIYSQTYGNGVTDIDGNEYESVIIGQQEWMAQNLRVTRYSDGSTLSYIEDNSSWNSLYSPAWCWYNNDSTNDSLYGKIYTFYAGADTNSKNICPYRWHVPSYQELVTLITYLGENGHYAKEGAALKSTSGWGEGNGTDNYGFNGLPGGFRNEDGVYYNDNYRYWWASTEPNYMNAYNYRLDGGDDDLRIYAFVKNMGFSIRCIKEFSVPEDTLLNDTTNYLIPYNDFKTAIYQDSIDSLSRIHNDGDSVIHYYSKFEFGENIYTDTAILEIFDTSEILIAVEDTLIITLNITTGLGQVEDRLSIWSDGQSIFFESSAQEGYAFELIDISGSIVLNVSDTYSSNQISLAYLSAGLYLAKFTSLSDNSLVLTKKIVLR
jgi:uncharacterized protein (TIGR02145 family)